MKKLFLFFWDKEFFRFLFASGVNTVVGYAVTLLFGVLIGFPDPWPTILNFVLCFPFAYTTQTKIAFRTKWELRRMFAYALTALPNLFIQWLLTIIFPEGSMHELIRYALVNILPLPIMFFVIRFVVTPLKKTKDQ